MAPSDTKTLLERIRRTNRPPVPRRAPRNGLHAFLTIHQWRLLRLTMRARLPEQIGYSLNCTIAYFRRGRLLSRVAPSRPLSLLGTARHWKWRSRVQLRGAPKLRLWMLRWQGKEIAQR